MPEPPPDAVAVAEQSLGSQFADRGIDASDDALHAMAREVTRALWEHLHAVTHGERGTVALLAELGNRPRVRAPGVPPPQRGTKGNAGSEIGFTAPWRVEG